MWRRWRSSADVPDSEAQVLHHAEPLDVGLDIPECTPLLLPVAWGPIGHELGDLGDGIGTALADIPSTAIGQVVGDADHLERSSAKDVFERCANRERCLEPARLDVG